MLVLNEAWCQHRAGTNAPDNFRQLDGVGSADFQMRVAIKFEKFNRDTKDFCRTFGFGDSLRRCAIRAGFPLGTKDEMHCSPCLRFTRDDAAATEFNVVGMRAEGQQRREFSLGFQGRLHRIGQCRRAG